MKLPSRPIETVAEQANATSNLPPGQIQTELARYEPQLLAAIYETIVDECHKRKTKPVWVYLPIPGSPDNDLRNRLMAIAEKSGFHAYDLTDWATSMPGLFQTSTDYHPNSQGHNQIAESLMKLIQRSPEILTD
jgi:hypothetical protein